MNNIQQSSLVLKNVVLSVLIEAKEKLKPTNNLDNKKRKIANILNSKFGVITTSKLAIERVVIIDNLFNLLVKYLIIGNVKFLKKYENKTNKETTMIEKRKSDSGRK